MRAYASVLQITHTLIKYLLASITPYIYIPLATDAIYGYIYFVNAYILIWLLLKIFISMIYFLPVSAK